MGLLSTPSRARRFFDRLAPAYDSINRRIFRPEWRDLILARIQGSRVLDVGVGTGYTTGHLEDAVGIDLSAEMLRRAKYRGHLLRADFLHAPFRERSFDTIVFAGSFYYMPDPETCLGAAAGLLRDGGVVIILAPAMRALAPLVHILDREDFAGLMAAVGLRLESFARLGRMACLAVGRRP